MEKRYILRVLEAVAGNKTAAARILGFERKTLYRKLERFGIEVHAGDRGEPRSGLGASGTRGAGAAPVDEGRED